MTPLVGSEPSHGSLRDYLMQQDSNLAEAANYTWRIACDIHDRQTEKGGNVNGRKHVEQVERNIWKLLSETHERPPGSRRNLDRLRPMDIYLLSCAACCHDFDKGLRNDVLGGEFKHGEGSGKFVFDNWEMLGIVGQAAAEYIDWIVSIHDCKEDFDERLQALPDIAGLPPLRRLATLLKAADTLHMDESRISRLAVPDDSLIGFDRLKQLARGNIHGWGLDGRRIVVTVSIKDEETAKALLNCARFVKQTEWPPIARNLREHQFPDVIHFKFIWPRPLEPQLVEQGLLTPDGTSVNFEHITSVQTISPPKAADALVLDEPFKIIAVQPEYLGTYLCEMGPLSVIDNVYVAPDLSDLGAKPGAVSRVFIGPANCGKTRAAYEWIREKVGLNTNAWAVLRPESGSIPQNVAKFDIDWKSRYGEQRRRPNRAILFVDDLPDFLPPPGSGPAAAEAVHRLFAWFRNAPGFQERCFVGTIRTERMVDKLDWPKKLLELGEDLRLLRIESLDEPKRRQLWQGMETARADLRDGVQALDLHFGGDFIDAVARRDADPETVSYFAREMALHDKRQLSADDAKHFSNDVVGIWLRETWPAIQGAYGAAASIFFTLARFIEAGAQSHSRFKGSLLPSWEYHAVYGPALLSENKGSPDDYVPAIERMLIDGHASGVVGEWIRPKFDFLLQAPAMDEVVVPLPSTEWFARYAHALTQYCQTAISFHFSCANSPYTQDCVTAHWQFGHALAMEFLANRDEANATPLYEKELCAYEELVRRFGDDETPAVREKVAIGLLNKGVVLGRLGRDEDELTAYEELVRRFGDDETPAVREKVAIGLLNKGVVLGRLGRDEEAVTAYEELVRRFGDDETPAVREKVAIGLLNKGVVLGRLRRDEEAVTAYEELVRRFGDDETPAVREKVAIGLLNKGVVLGRLGRDEEAVTAYEELVRRFGDDETPAVREKVAGGPLNKGVVLGRLGRDEDELTAYEELVRRFGDDETPAVREKVAIGLLNKGVVLGRLGRDEDELTAYEELVRRFGDDETPAVREKVAIGLFNKGVVLGRLGRDEEAVTAYEELVRRFGDDETPAVRERVAGGPLNKGVVLGRLGRDEDELTAYEELVRRFGNDETPAVREKVAIGLLNKGVVLGRLGRDEDELTAYEELVRRFGDDETPAVREKVAIGLNNKCAALSSRWRKTRTRSFLDQAIAAGRACVAMGGVIYNLACAFALAGKQDEAFQLLEKCLRDGKNKWTEVQDDSDWADVRNDPRYSELEVKYREES